MHAGRAGRRIGVALLALAAASGCGGDEAPARSEPTTTEPALPGDCVGDLVLVASVIGQYEEGGDIVGLTADGEVRHLTDDGQAFGPTLSPDASEVAFAAVGPGGEVSDSFGPYKLDIVVVAADGSGRRTVVDGQDARVPDWAPDGEHIAYVELGDPDSSADPDRIHVVAPDGTGDRVLVAHDGAEDDDDPAWSPDGRRLAFVRRSDDGGSQVVVASADGSGQRVVHESTTWIGAPAWSPDGERLAFPAGETSQGGTLVVLTLATGEVVEGLGPVEGLAWAPSTRIQGYARPPAVRDFSGRWRVTELEPTGDGFADGRAVSALDPVGYLYTDYEVDTPACTGSGTLPLTSERDDPEALVIAHPETGEDVVVMTREQAVAVALGDRPDDPDAVASAMLVYGDAATQAAVDGVAPSPGLEATTGTAPPRPGPSLADLPDGELVWLVAHGGGLTVLRAATGEQLSAGGGPGLGLPDVPDLAA